MADKIKRKKQRKTDRFITNKRAYRHTISQCLKDAQDRANTGGDDYSDIDEEIDLAEVRLTHVDGSKKDI